MTPLTALIGQAGTGICPVRSCQLDQLGGRQDSGEQRHQPSPHAGRGSQVSSSCQGDSCLPYTMSPFPLRKYGFRKEEQTCDSASGATQPRLALQMGCKVPVKVLGTGMHL